MFGISRSSFSARARIWILAGRLHPLQVNGEGRVYYPPWELEELLESVNYTEIAPELAAVA